MNLFELIRQADGIKKVLSSFNSKSINSLNEFGQNLLHEAIASNKTGIGAELIERKIDVNHQDYKGMTPLHFTSWHNNVELAKLIIAHGGDLEIKDKHGNTALWYAVHNAKGKNYDLIELLVNAGANAIAKNNYSKSPVDFATQINDERLIKILSKKI